MQDNKNWEFVFIGANIDAVETANNIGIDREYAFNYIADRIGNSIVYNSISKKISTVKKAVRGCKSSNESLYKITKDHKKRSKVKK